MSRQHQNTGVILGSITTNSLNDEDKNTIITQIESLSSDFKQFINNIITGFSTNSICNEEEDSDGLCLAKIIAKKTQNLSDPELKKYYDESQNAMNLTNSNEKIKGFYHEISQRIDSYINSGSLPITPMSSGLPRAIEDKNDQKKLKNLPIRFGKGKIGGKSKKSKKKQKKGKSKKNKGRRTILKGGAGELNPNYDRRLDKVLEKCYREPVLIPELKKKCLDIIKTKYMLDSYDETTVMGKYYEEYFEYFKKKDKRSSDDRKLNIMKEVMYFCLCGMTFGLFDPY